MSATCITYNAGFEQSPVLRRSRYRVPGYASVIRMAGRLMAASRRGGPPARAPARYLRSPACLRPRKRRGPSVASWPHAVGLTNESSCAPGTLSAFHTWQRRHGPGAVVVLPRPTSCPSWWHTDELPCARAAFNQFPACAREVAPGAGPWLGSPPPVPPPREDMSHVARRAWSVATHQGELTARRLVITFVPTTGRRYVPTAACSPGRGRGALTQQPSAIATAPLDEPDG
jgi:hypothetical protein